MPVFLVFVIVDKRYSVLQYSGRTGDSLYSGLLLCRLQTVKLLQGDFMQIWLDFVIVVTGVMLFQLVMFSLLNLAIPAVTPILFQIGSTLILFPIGYLTLFSGQPC